MSNPFLVGIDMGTTGCRAVVYDRHGREVATSYLEYEVSTPQPGWAEQDPDTWWQASVHVLGDAVAKAQLDPADLAAIGVTGQQPSPVFIDKDGGVLGPSLIWMDQRTTSQCEEIETALGADRVYRVTGLRVDTNYAASKVLWVRQHWPDVYARTHKILLAKDFLVHRLTGHSVSDYATSASTLLLDIYKLQWWDDILQALDISEDKLPSLCASTDLAGPLLPEVAERTGLLAGTPVYTCAGDTTAQAVGTRVVAPGETCAVIGTSCDVVTCTAAPVTDPQRRFGCYPHAVAGRYVIISGANGGGVSLRWFRDQFCQLETETASRLGLSAYALMDLQAAQTPPGAGGIIFLPYVMGERSPVFDPLAQGVFFGVSLRHTKGHLIRAIMEGVACSIRHRVAIGEEQGVEVPRIYIAGGGGNSDVWRQIVADVTGTPNEAVQATEATCIGAAILAGVGAGLYTSVEAACAEILPTAGLCEARAETGDLYDDLFDVYVRLYEQTKSLWPAVHRVAGG